MSTASATVTLPADWRDFLALTKPRVMTLVVFTGLCGMLAAPVPIHPVLGFTAILCIALGAGAAGALNQWYEADLDAKMKRTARRPLPAGRMDRQSALHFGVGLAGFSLVLMYFAINLAATLILAASILFYVFVYTIWLKRRTPQNIVIGGASGAMPPVLGWAAMRGELGSEAWLMCLIIFLWTPPHFWALALYRSEDYRKAGLPMLPVTHGNEFTRLQIFLYTWILFAATLLPFLTGMSGWIYLAAALVLGLMFCYYAFKLWRAYSEALARKTFMFSLLHLSLLFGALLLDHYVSPWIS